MSCEIEPIAREEAMRRAHEEAAVRQDVELYLLNELTEAERARFEEHYFECGECADAVAAGQTFLTHISVTDMSPRAVRRVWWQQPAAAIAALFLLVVGGQQFVIGQQAAPQANSVILARPLEKGVEEKAYRLRTPSATIEASLPGDAGYLFYLVKIVDGQGRRLEQVVPAPMKDSEQRLSVQAPRKTLGVGHFSVEIEGLREENAKRGPRVGEAYEFDLK
jgi:hypothetical protein